MENVIGGACVIGSFGILTLQILRCTLTVNGGVAVGVGEPQVRRAPPLVVQVGELLVQRVHGLAGAGVLLPDRRR
ncbi:hypothetical protein [Spirillospora sp. NBC_01491]|uniref:hypothetical protein n=1 Tax=Spirillospora sp. NBC_01491 TaxID=2976007 RepID=UPI002E307CF5|nr:hypothetical protein [Spirillospora sp. NBC_01491]